MDKLGTKEATMNGNENTCVNIVNGDPKTDPHCDISGSDSKSIVTNGIVSDSDDTKSNKSDEGSNLGPSSETIVKVTETKSVSSKKKENKRNHSSVEKNKESSKKKTSTVEKTDGKKEYTTIKKTEKLPQNVNGESKIVNGDKDRESSPSEDGDDKKRDAEVVFIQDMGFTVKIVSPRAEPLDIQVSLFVYIFFPIIQTILNLY